MAHRIISVQTITVSSTAKEIEVPHPGRHTAAPGVGYGEFQYSDKIIYVFDDFTGSFSLVQSSTDTAGLKIYDTVKPSLSGPWELKIPPVWLYNSGSNSQSVTVTTILVRS